VCFVYEIVDCFMGGIFCVVYDLYVVDIPCVKPYVFVSSICFRCVFSKYCKKISAMVLDMGEPIETPFSG
jgi:hypothetical protein